MPYTGEATLRTGVVFHDTYEVLEEIGAGGFGRVYRARQLSTGQDVAIKVLRRRPGDTAGEAENQAERFRREMRLCAGLSHPNIVRLIDSGEAAEGQLYAVFEYVPGVTLREVLVAERRLGLGETVQLMTQVLDALSCAHARGVVHRDLKPENVMVTKTGARRNALVLDFGLGGLAREAAGWALPRLTATHELMGTPCYAAPEQLRGEAPTTRSDLYSWGLIFLECLTGETAVGGASAAEVLMRQLGPEPVVIPEWLRRQRLGRLLEVVTAKQAEKRDVTVEALLETMSRVEHGEHPQPHPATQAPLPEGERRQLTVVSCRLTPWPLADRALDVEEVDELLHTQHAVYAEMVRRAGGQIASVLADRLLLVFGYPRAQEDDARRAARTALSIAGEAARSSVRLEAERKLRLEVRIGIHTGLMIVRELSQAAEQALFDPVGLTPEVAGRLEEMAAPGEVLASADTLRLLRGEFAAQPAGELRTSEHTAVIPVFRLTGEQRRPAGEGMPAAGETPLVGRAHQLRQLLAIWEEVQRGRPAAVLITGEPGIGKSRLVRELRRRIGPGGWLEGRCLAENQQSPLRPFVDLMLASGESIESLLTQHGFDLGETLPLFSALLGVPLDDRYAPLQLTPERRKELTLAGVLSLLLRMARQRPRVLVLEDVHWADPTTLELATLLIEEVRTAHVVVSEPAPRLCVVLTARPEFGAPWGLDGPAVIQLPRLLEQEVETMVAASLTSEEALPRTLVERVIERSDGIPLFVEEVTRVLLEAGGRDAVGVEIPVSLRDLLTARLDRLSPSARDTIQLAAVLGREFRYELLRAVSRREESILREDVRELMDVGLLYMRSSVRSEAYVFKHALVRDAADESMTRPRRQALHARVASTLRQHFPDLEQHRPEILAQHFEQAREVETAAGYWLRAGEAAFKRGAYPEARQQFEHGLRLLETAPPSSECKRLQVQLLTMLGTVLYSVQGSGTDEVQQTFARARQLCVELGDDIPLKVLSGVMTVALARGDRAATAELLPRYHRLAAQDDPVASITGHAVLGLYAFWSGDFLAARDHMSVGTRLYGTEEFQRFAHEYGWDGGLFCHAYRMTSLWHLGYPDQAEAARRELTALAQVSRNPYSIGLALGFGATLLYYLGEIEALVETCDRLIALASEQRLYAWLPGAYCGRGAALRERGEVDAAIAQIRQGLDLFEAMGVRISYAYYLTYLAAAYRDAGRVEQGLAVVEEGFSLCRTLFACFQESELLRLKGQLLQLGGDAAGAEASLRASFDLGRRRSAKSHELRAAVGLGRLLPAQGRTAEARALLADVYGSFTEGFETRELREARMLLTELG